MPKPTDDPNWIMIPEAATAAERWQQIVSQLSGYGVVEVAYDEDDRDIIWSRPVADHQP